MLTWNDRDLVVFCGLTATEVDPVCTFTAHNDFLYNKLLRGAPYASLWQPRPMANIGWAIETITHMRAMLRRQAGYTVSTARGRIREAIEALARAKYTDVRVSNQRNWTVVGWKVEALRKLQPFIERPHELMETLSRRFEWRFSEDYKGHAVAYWQSLLDALEGKATSRYELPESLRRMQLNMPTIAAFKALYAKPPDMTAHTNALKALVAALAAGRKANTSAVAKVLGVAVGG